MEMRSHTTNEEAKTPNCVNCSRSMEHTLCRVMRLFGNDWLIEQTPHRAIGDLLSSPTHPAQTSPVSARDLSNAW
jgi:hypothetical protein